MYSVKNEEDKNTYMLRDDSHRVEVSSKNMVTRWQATSWQQYNSNDCDDDEGDDNTGMLQEQ